MFEPVHRLGTELSSLAQESAALENGELARSVAKFVTEVADEVDKAFGDVHDVLREIAFLSPASESAEEVNRIQSRLAATYSREKFKNVLEICARLDTLAHDYRNNIQPYLQVGPHHSELFWLLEKHEGSFIYTIRSAVDEVQTLLDTYSKNKDLTDARARARKGLRELEAGLAEVIRAKQRVIGSLPGGTTMLLEGKIADRILRDSPWFSGSFYLATTLILLTALTIVAGNTRPLAFPFVTVAAFAGLTIIGAFQLKNDGRLSEASFVHLLDLAMRRVLLPLSKVQPTGAISADLQAVRPQGSAGKNSVPEEDAVKDEEQGH